MREQQYPIYHKEIVNDLLEGKFLLNSDFGKFDSITKDKDFYIKFFEQTFGYELIIRSEFAYLESDNTDEKLSRDFTIFLCILCYELNQLNSDFKKRIENDLFTLEEVTTYLQNKNFKEVIIEIGMNDDINTFLGKLAKRNIIEFEDKNRLRFRFTRAVDLFFDFALDLSRKQNNEKDLNKSN